MKEAKYLKRDGMGPLTPNFARAYREYYDYERAGGEERKHPLEGMDAGAFCTSLRWVGLADTKDLAGVLGVGVRTAQYIKRNPSRMTKKQHLKLCEWLKDEEDSLFMDYVDVYYLFEEGALEEGEIQKALRAHGDFSRHANALRMNKPFADLTEALSEEMSFRFLVEAFAALEAQDRKTVSRMVKGFLMQTDTPEAHYVLRMVQPLMKPHGLQASLSWLADLTAGDSEELDNLRCVDNHEGSDLFGRAVLDEYTGYKGE